jgi:antitoxin VapB
MALTSKNPEPEQESFEEKRDRAERIDRLLRYLEEKVWPNVPAELREKGISKQEREEILGYGPEGV